MHNATLFQYLSPDTIVHVASVVRMCLAWVQEQPWADVCVLHNVDPFCALRTHPSAYTNTHNGTHYHTRPRDSLFRYRKCRLSVPALLDTPMRTNTPGEVGSFYIEIWALTYIRERFGLLCGIFGSAATYANKALHRDVAAAWKIAPLIFPRASQQRISGKIISVGSEGLGARARKTAIGWWRSLLLSVQSCHESQSVSRLASAIRGSTNPKNVRCPTRGARVPTYIIHGFPGLRRAEMWGNSRAFEPQCLVGTNEDQK